MYKIPKYKTQENLKVFIQDQDIFLCFLIMLFGDWPWPHSIREIEGYCSAGEKKTCCIQHPQYGICEVLQMFRSMLHICAHFLFLVGTALSPEQQVKDISSEQKVKACMHDENYRGPPIYVKSSHIHHLS